MEKTKQQQKLLKDKYSKRAKAEHAAYDAGMTKTAQSLTAQLRNVARNFCAEVQSEALNTTGVEADSDLRGADKVYYPPTLCLAPSIALPPPNPSFTSLVPKSTTTSTIKSASEKDKEQPTSMPIVELESEMVVEVEQLKKKNKDEDKEVTS